MAAIIDCDGQHITWGESQVRRMAKLIGAETAMRRRVAANVAILRWADDRRLVLSSRARRMLHDAEQERIVWASALDRRDFGRRPKFFPHVHAAIHAIEQSPKAGLLLADEVGVGKTPIAVARIEARDTLTRPALVITTNSAKHQWQRAIAKFGRVPHVVRIVEGTTKQQMRIIESARAGDIVIGHWESLQGERAIAYTERGWSTVVADEAQYIWNRDTQRAKTMHLLSRVASQRLALTAHPYTKGPDQLWSILHFLYPDQYSSFWRFFDMHVDADPKPFGGFDINGPRRPKLLQWEIAPFTIRRTRRQVRSTLPRISRISRYVTLPPKGQIELEQLKKQLFAELETLDGTRRLPILNALARTTRIRQYLVNPDLLGSTVPAVKNEAVLDIMHEVQRPVVIFSAFRQALERLATTTLKHHHVGMITGAVAPEDRERIRRRFVEGKLDAVLVVSSAGREAINLSGHGIVIHLDMPWTPKDLEQTEGRVDRPHEDTGQSIPCTSYRIVVEHSFEERMEEKLDDRHRQFGRVFTVNDLRGLFA